MTMGAQVPGTGTLDCWGKNVPNSFRRDMEFSNDKIAR
jgi:hypothetical protein